MRAIQMAEYGAPEVLRPAELPTPQAGPGQILVAVRSAGVNFADIMRRRNDPYPDPTPLPFVPGAEIAGVVAELGDGVDHPAVGTRVFGFAGATGEGGYAEYVAMNAAGAVPLPPSLDEDQASGLMLTGLSALLIVREAGRLQRGETIFVPAASGGVGGYAVRIAKLLGATVIGGASTPEKRAQAMEAGADATVAYREAGWVDEVLDLTGGRGADVVLDVIGPAHLATSLRVLAPFGRLVAFGTAGGPGQRLDPDGLDSLLYAPAPGQTLTGFNLMEWLAHRPEIVAGALGDLVAWAADGVMSAPPVQRFPLERAAEAHALMESAGSSGKLVLRP